MNEFLSKSFIPLIMALALLVYGIRLIITKDPGIILGKDARGLKDEEKFSLYAGALMIFLAIGSIAMAVTGYFFPVASFVIIITCIAIFAILWVRVNQKYGKK